MTDPEREHSLYMDTLRSLLGEGGPELTPAKVVAALEWMWSASMDVDCTQGSRLAYIDLLRRLLALKDVLSDLDCSRWTITGNCARKE